MGCDCGGSGESGAKRARVEITGWSQRGKEGASAPLET